MSSSTPQLTPVGQLLSDELESRGWTQADFATVLDRPSQVVSEIVTGKKEITRESAAQIGAALGQTPEFWLAFQDQYLLGEQAKNGATQRTLEDVRRRARLNRLAPISTLRRRGVLVASSLDELEDEVKQLFEIESLDDEPDIAHAARRSNDGDPVSSAQMAWLACVRRAARARIMTATMPEVSKEHLQKIAAELPALLRDPGRFAILPDLLASAGVVLVYVEALPGAKIDGCSFYLDSRPVIGISGRGKRLDKVLFTTLHEIAHVTLDHVAEQLIVDSALDDQDDTNDDEKKANELAGNWLLPRPLPVLPERISTTWVEKIAAEWRVPPIVVVGRLQNDGVLEWRSTLAKSAPTVSEALEAW